MKYTHAGWVFIPRLASSADRPRKVIGHEAMRSRSHSAQSPEGGRELVDIDLGRLHRPSLPLMPRPLRKHDGAKRSAAAISRCVSPAALRARAHSRKSTESKGPCSSSDA